MLIVQRKALDKAAAALVECAHTAADAVGLRVSLPLTIQDAEQRVLAMIALSAPPGAVGVVPEGTHFCTGFGTPDAAYFPPQKKKLAP